MKALYRFFLSLRTVFGLFLAFIVIAVAGSFSLVRNLAFFSGIDDLPLFRWLAASGTALQAWWIHAMICLIGLLAVSTICCTVDALLHRIGRQNFLLRVSPQVMHLGVLFIMLGHLLTASAGFKTDLVVGTDRAAAVTQDASVILDSVEISTDRNGYTVGWDVRLRWQEKGVISEQKVLGPVRPVFFGKYGIYSKSVAAGPEVSAQVRVCSDPGALWALLGGVLLAAGGAGFLYARMNS